MDLSCLVSTVQAGGGVMVWGKFSWHTLGPLVPVEHWLNATAYLSIVADHVHPFMTTVYHLLMATSSRIMHHVTKIKSSQTGFLNMTMSSLYSNGLHSQQIAIQYADFTQPPCWNRSEAPVVRNPEVTVKHQPGSSANAIYELRCGRRHVCFLYFTVFGIRGGMLKPISSISESAQQLDRGLNHPCWR